MAWHSADRVAGSTNVALRPMRSRGIMSLAGGVGLHYPGEWKVTTPNLEVL